MKSNVRTHMMIAVALLALLAAVLPQQSAAQGESAVPFLLIAPNSRASGIGESGTGTVDDASAIYWNPAGLAFLNGYEVSVTHANWLPQFGQSDLFYDHLNYRMRVDEIGGTLGAAVTYLNLGEFIRTSSAGLPTCTWSRRRPPASGPLTRRWSTSPRTAC